MKIVDKDGDVLYSANPQDVIIKKMENKNQIPSAKSLRELQTHLDKVAAHRAQNEFGKAGKITDKSLLKFTNREKQTLKNLEESINPMLTYVHKQLDAIQKGEFKESLEELAKGRTTLVIAHRLSTIRNAKMICVVGEEGIIERGTHDELLALNGAYARLYNKKF